MAEDRIDIDEQEAGRRKRAEEPEVEGHRLATEGPERHFGAERSGQDDDDEGPEVEGHRKK